MLKILNVFIFSLMYNIPKSLNQGSAPDPYKKYKKENDFLKIIVYPWNAEKWDRNCIQHSIKVQKGSN
ncbi:hypothetical protein BpHYR1_036510 [Brachionus plicatilis]|uniref:Uncharacterized protein n=1 Tax=Brachionus plicatilis TaxID=10195 RepID=A0A3M7RNI0_BRAPC|nr:hypothetical protein BpHYR1_036510 [Brachionus plicatilis]